MSTTKKVYWVTGASGALGGSIAAALAATGADVVASSRKSGDALTLRDGLHWLGVDVTDDASVRRAAATILDRFGQIDGLVTSTNLPIFGEFDELTDEDWLTVINVKLLGSLRPLRAVAPAMEARGEGAVLLISGTGRGTPPSLKHLPGASMNAALNFLVPGLASRYGPKGIRVNAIAPGPIQSPRHDQMKKIGSGGSGIKLPIDGTPDDVAHAALYLMSPQARFITGITVPVDGGGRL